MICNSCHSHPCCCPPSNTRVPLNFTAILNYIQGVSKDGCPEVLRKAAGSILATDSSGRAKLVDGSAQNPLQTPDFQQSRVPATVLLAQDEAGEWYGLLPSEEEQAKGKLQLVFEAGVGYWESIGANKTVYNREDVANASCDYSIAGWQECDGSDQSKLVRIPLSDLVDKVFGLDNIATADGAACIDYILVGQGGVTKKLAPSKDQYLVSRLNKITNEVCWILESLPVAVASAIKRVFNYTGYDQSFTVPTGVTKMKGKLWGAGGSSDRVGDPFVISGGVGGYTEFEMDVTPGTEYRVVVGFGKHNLAGYPYGFGGYGQGQAHQSNGSGLTGIFTGNSQVVAADYTRALAIAGGGGAGGQSGGGGNASRGGNGNAIGGTAPAGGMPDMQGNNSTGGVNYGNGGGGGGYRGGAGKGLGGYGGTGYVDGVATQSSIQYAADNTAVVPGATDPDYNGQAGKVATPGLAVIIFS